MNLEELSTKAQWLNLIHYQKRAFSKSYKSLAQGESFFFSKKGKHYPKAELKRTLQAFIQDFDSIRDGSSICRFPGRFLFLSKHIPSFEGQLLKSCSEYQEFFDRLDSEAVALVFSSYYINSPASAYGHTLLRFMKSPDKSGHQHQLLDYAVNYSANVTTANDFLYAFYGLSGFFQGEFAVMPYFYKLREYSDYESRDLWSYQLDITEDQIEMLIAHIWEMRQTHFKYYYLTQNCSYHMLSILDVANPEWNLVQRNPYIVIPVDTIKTIVNTNELDWELSYHPSKLREAMARVKKLKPEEQKILNRLLNEKNEIDEVLKSSSWSKFNKKQKAKVLDAAIDMIDFRHAQDILFTHQAWHQRKNKILRQRSRLNKKSLHLEIEMPQEEKPHLGHGSRRIGLSLGEASSQKEFIQLDYRLSYHDLYDPPKGHFQNSSIEMGKLNLRYYNSDNKIKLEEFTLLNVHNIPPYKKFFFSPSWNVSLGVERYRQDSQNSSCQACLVSAARFGIGVSFELGHLHTALLIQTEGLLSKHLSRRGFRFGVGPKIHSQWKIDDKTKIGVQAQALNVWPKYGQQTENLKYQISSTFRRGLGQNTAYGLDASFEKYENVLKAQYFYYF